MQECETREFSNGVTVTSFGASSPKYTPQRNPSSASNSEDSSSKRYFYNFGAKIQIFENLNFGAKNIIDKK